MKSAPTSKPPVGEAEHKAVQVQAMFAAIAGRYDLLNRVLSLGVDRSWRSHAAREVLALSPASVLDVATGTADFALEVKRRAPEARVVGCDFVPQMLEIGRRKARTLQLEVQLEEGDALNLPYPDASFDALSCAFGFRNFSDYRRGLEEFYRVLRPGGRAVILEFPPPQPNLLGSAFRLYFEHLLPRIGQLVSGSDTAYRYLPESVLAFPPPKKLAQLMEEVGFKARYRLLTFGIAAVHIGVKPA
ncbi:demethylmenaquinone methyltransferase/2-methoxy-6-polyprenyl-1,4-benzoquinol methylase [Deinobacterium chartae]|uniref:Demethylmenaquinone methyltransferase n=1 Tax=Deinobacterium chartae TaxID=521158 RepID=A0A841HZG3_9DEIO|nr:bifunctional demethylmenaquinone methyltransferase/2-methoxy-6-polyprenyl-1,4-benzoquinol methylase UbiE [Deinobacterium chartae]MBB6098333.1 demethylmenaquinone methyltransferase/2-methoxy-6-polyprenyl-1,4-benzoquinol methylase [Deinobacterium chartae]